MNKEHTPDFLPEETLLFSMIADSLAPHEDPVPQQTGAARQTTTQQSDPTQPAGVTQSPVKETAASTLHALIELAGHQAVLPIIYPILSKEKNLTDEDRNLLEGTTRQTAAEFYQIFFNARKLTDLFKKAEIPVVLLKGASIARLYPMPESRRSSDVDLFLPDPDDLSRTTELLEENGYRLMDEQHANHHELWGTPDNHALELHAMLMEPTENKTWNEYVKKRYHLTADELLEETILGVSFPIFPDDLLAFHLLLHMLMDFLGSGFGLKLLCDWVVFWNRDVGQAQTERFLKDVENCGLSGFLSAITTVCVRFLGLHTDGSGTLIKKEDALYYSTRNHDKKTRHDVTEMNEPKDTQDDNSPDARDKLRFFCKISPEALAHEFMQEILDAERHGKPDDARMVALQGTGLKSYITAFHHQTVLSFPKLSHLIFPLPVLYIIVFTRFLKNNKTVRGGQSISGILKKTGQRSKLVKKIIASHL